MTSLSAKEDRTTNKQNVWGKEKKCVNSVERISQLGMRNDQILREKPESQ